MLPAKSPAGSAPTVIRGPTRPRLPAAGGGGRAARATRLLFLHADCRLPPEASAAIEEALAAPEVRGGAFRIRYRGGGKLLDLGARLANWRAGLTRCPLGDHAIFVRRAVFEELGGFREWPLLEDLDFARRLARRGPTVLLPALVATSARRFERLGLFRTVATNWLIFLLYLAGISPARLARSTTTAGPAGEPINEKLRGQSRAELRLRAFPADPRASPADQAKAIRGSP